MAFAASYYGGMAPFVCHPEREARRQPVPHRRSRNLLVVEAEHPAKKSPPRRSLHRYHSLTLTVALHRPKLWVVGHGTVSESQHGHGTWELQAFWITQLTSLGFATILNGPVQNVLNFPCPAGGYHRQTKAPT